MSEYKIFDIEKAEELRIVYKKKRHYAKERLVKHLITWQQFFGNNTSIVGVTISLSGHYQRKTV